MICGKSTHKYSTHTHTPVQRFNEYFTASTHIIRTHTHIVKFKVKKNKCGKCQMNIFYHNACQLKKGRKIYNNKSETARRVVTL